MHRFASPPRLLVFCALLLGAVSPAFCADEAQVPWEQMTSEKVPAFALKRSITQSEFERFCNEHQDTEVLGFDGCSKLTSLAPLAGLTKVTRLSLQELNQSASSDAKSRCFDLGPLGGMKNLQEVYFGTTRISNVAALKGLTKLRSVDFNGNEIESLDGLPDSVEELNLYYAKKIKDYGSLERMKLKSINVYVNSQATPKNLNGLKGMESLEVFKASLTKAVTDIGFLTECPNLREVDLWNDPVSDFSPLNGKTKLEVVGLSGTPVKTLEFLTRCTELKRLYVEETAIADLAPLAGKAKLDDLNLSGTKITNLAPLKNCPALHRVVLSQTAIADISPLAGKTSLWVLDLSKTKVTNLAPVASCKRLTGLKLSQTPVTDITPLLGLKKLSHVTLPIGVPAKQIEALKAANPKVTVEIDKPASR